MKQPIADLLREQLNKDDWEFVQDRERRFYVSDMGKCHRARWVKRHGLRTEFEPLVNWIMMIGKLYHDWGYKTLQPTGRLLSSEEEMKTPHWSGRFDGVIRLDPEMLDAPSQQVIERGYAKNIFDIKSINAWKLMNKIMEGKGIMEYVKQLHMYLLLLRDEGREDLDDNVAIVFINKEPHDKKAPVDFHQVTYPFTKNDERELREEMKLMEDYWENKKVPPCTCPGWMKDYNNYLSFCKASKEEVVKWLGMITDENSLLSNKKGLYLVDNKDQFEEDGKTRKFIKTIKTN